MRSQNSVLAHTTKSLSSFTLTTNQTNAKDRPTVPVGYISSKTPNHETKEKMTTGSGISTGNNNSVSVPQKSNSITLFECNSNNHKASTTTATHHYTGIASNSALEQANTNNSGQNYPILSKLQILEHRKFELEKLLNQKNWLLAQIHKQEAQILNGTYENFNLLEIGKLGSGTANSILRRKGSSNLKLNKNSIHLYGKNNRLILSKSEYDLAQEDKNSNHRTTTNPNVVGIKKRQGVPLKTNSFHDSTSKSALGLTPTFEYNGKVGDVTDSNQNIKFRLGRAYGSTENLANSISQQPVDKTSSTTSVVTQCDKYYLSPTSQMYSDGSGFIKASQNIKQCLSPAPTHRIFTLNNQTEAHRNRQKQQQHAENSNDRVVHHQNGSQSHSEQYDNIDALSLSPSTICTFEQGPTGNIWRTMSVNDRATWCDTTSYVELDNELGNSYPNMKSLPKKMLPTFFSGSSVYSPESPSKDIFYVVGDEISISSANSETNKKPKKKQWMESSLDGPIIRPNILKNPTSFVDTDVIQSSVVIPGSSGGKMTALPVQTPVGGGSVLTVATTSSHPPSRTLAHQSHPKQRERTQLSSQSMSNGSYRPPKSKLDDDNIHLSHSTSFLNVDPYHHRHHPHFQLQSTLLQQTASQLYNHNHYLMDISNSNICNLSHHQTYQPQQKPPKQLFPSPVSPVLQFSTFTAQPHADTMAQPPSKPSQNMTKNPMQMPFSIVTSTASPDIRIESPKNMTVVQQATFLPYKEVTKPFEMSDFYKYSTKFRQKEPNADPTSKNYP